MSCPACGNAAAECIVHPNYWHCPSSGCRNHNGPAVRTAGVIECNVPHEVDDSQGVRALRILQPCTQLACFNERSGALLWRGLVVAAIPKIKWLKRELVRVHLGSDGVCCCWYHCP